jgi:pilus assembly protein CpaD
MAMKKKLSTVLLLLAAGCSNPHLAINRGVDTTKAPVVQVTSTAYDLRVGPGGRLSGEQVRALDEYLGSIGLAYGDRVGIDDPSAAGGAERREAVAQVVARHGLLLDETVPVTAGTVVPGVLRVVVTRARASVPGCPDWS